MAYDPRAYVPGGSSSRVAKAIATKGKKVVKKTGIPTKKSTATAAPSIAGLTLPQISSMTPSQVALYGAAVQSAGPDYSAVPKADFSKLQSAAWQQAEKQVAAQVKPYEAERATLKTNLSSSTKAATEFAKAFASIAGGGNANIDDQAAQKYALENYGGSYVGGMAASLGAQLIGQQQSYFTAQDGKYAAQILEIMDTRPDLAEKIYTAAADDAADQIKQGRSIAEMSFKNKLGAIAALGKAMSGAAGGANVTYVTQPGGGVVGFDKATGKIVYTIAGTGSTAGKASQTRLRSVGGSVYEQDPATGKWSVAIPGKSSGGSGGESASTVSNTVKRATTAGDTALEKLTDKVWAKTPGADSEVGTPEYAKATAVYQSLLRKSFGSAMYRVITAIGPHLKTVGYTPAQVKRRAYEIVSAEIDPPKNYKVPTAKNVSYSVDLVTPKTGVMTSSPWKGNHVTDNLGWGTKTAVDIMASPGTPVGAPEDGTIVRWGSAQGGQALYFQSASGKLYWLGHIDSMLPVGTKVLEDQPIALISSDHPSPHLHIDVRGRTV